MFDSPDDIAAAFRNRAGSFAFARWGRPLAPVVFGVDEATIGGFRAGLDAVLAYAGTARVETDPEMGANLMVFVLRNWVELGDIPDLEALVPGLPALGPELARRGANQYRHFRHDADGAIRAAFVFLRLDDALAAAPLPALALDQMLRIALIWGEAAFAAASPVVMTETGYALRPEIAALLRAAYDPRLPVASGDPALALRLFARLAA